MTNKQIGKQLVMVAVLFTLLADGVTAQQQKQEHEIIAVEYLGDFASGDTRDRAISEAVAKLQRQTPTLSYKSITYRNHPELLAIVRAWDAISEDVVIDSTWAVLISVTAYRQETKYIICFQGLPLANNPYSYWVYRGDKK